MSRWANLSHLPLLLVSRKQKRAQRMTRCAQDLMALSSRCQSMRTAVVIVPIAIAVPAVVVFVPPLVVRLPAILAGFPQFVPRALRLRAVPTVVLHGFVNLMIRFRQAMLALPFVCASCGRAGEHQKSGKSGAGQDPFPKPVLSQTMLCFHPILLVFR
jgi:hypothetical protein